MFSLGDLDLIFKVLVLLVEYRLNQWMDFPQTCINISLRQAKELICFW